MKIVFKEHGRLTEITSEDGINLLNDLMVIDITIGAKVGAPTTVVLNCYLTESVINVLPENVTVFLNAVKLTSKQRKAIAAILAVDEIS